MPPHEHGKSTNQINHAIKNNAKVYGGKSVIKSNPQCNCTKQLFYVHIIYSTYRLPTFIHQNSQHHCSKASLTSNKMQAKPIHSIPTYFPPSIRPPPVHQDSLSPATIPRAISISAPDTRVAIPVPPTIELDDAITAFWDYQFLFVSQRSETTQPVTLRIVDGSVPSDFPSGTYYLTGPGLFADDHGSTVHPLDGHGYLRAFTIDSVNKKVQYMAKYIKTEAQVEEHDPKTNTWRFTHRGPFSVLKGGRKVGNTKVMKNVANTSVLRWGEKLLCMWEGGDPYEIEPGTLDTIGRYNMMDACDLEKHDDSYGGDVWEVAAGLLKPLLYGTY